jgi:hypothetical protein
MGCHGARLTTAEAHIAVLQAHDLLDVLDLGVVGDLQRAGVPHVEQLAPACQRAYHRGQSFAPLCPVQIRLFTCSAKMGDA